MPRGEPGVCLAPTMWASSPSRIGRCVTVPSSKYFPHMTQRPPDRRYTLNASVSLMPPRRPSPAMFFPTLIDRR